MCYFFDRLTGRTIENVINMGSYNYLGFAENNVDFLKTVAEETRQYGVGVCSTRQELGMCGYTTNETYLQSQKQVTHRIQHCLFKNKHSRLLSNYFGLVNAITNLSKAFFPIVIRPALSSVHRIPPSQIDVTRFFSGWLIKGPTCFWICSVSWWLTELLHISLYRNIICVMISQMTHNDLPHISMLKYVDFRLKAGLFVLRLRGQIVIWVHVIFFKALMLRFPQW